MINEIQRHNKDGWPSEGREVLTFGVSTSNKARKAAEAFFKTQPHLTTADVMDNLADCVVIKALDPAPASGFDKFWKARRGGKPQQAV